MFESDPVEQQLSQAKQALDNGSGAHKADLSDAVIINRLYYTCFHAAQAVLYERGFEPESHGAVHSLFGSAVVVKGDASRAQGRFRNDLSTVRKQADYGYEPIDEDIGSLIKEAMSFLETMRLLAD